MCWNWGQETIRGGWFFKVCSAERKWHWSKKKCKVISPKYWADRSFAEQNNIFSLINPIHNPSHFQFHLRLTPPRSSITRSKQTNRLGVGEEKWTFLSNGHFESMPSGERCASEKGRTEAWGEGKVPPPILKWKKGNLRLIFVLIP